MCRGSIGSGEICGRRRRTGGDRRNRGEMANESGSNGGGFTPLVHVSWAWLSAAVKKHKLELDPCAPLLANQHVGLTEGKRKRVVKTCVHTGEPCAVLRIGRTATTLSEETGRTSTALPEEIGPREVKKPSKNHRRTVGRKNHGITEHGHGRDQELSLCATASASEQHDKTEIPMFFFS